MGEAKVLVTRQAAGLWIGVGLLIVFNIFAAFHHSVSLVWWALALTGSYALFVIAFALWAAKTVSASPKLGERIPPRPESS